jgi:hypothetical protein
MRLEIAFRKKRWSAGALAAAVLACQAQTTKADELSAGGAWQ